MHRQSVFEGTVPLFLLQIRFAEKSTQRDGPLYPNIYARPSTSVCKALGTHTSSLFIASALFVSYQAG